MVTRRMEWNGCNVTTITFDAMRGTRGVEYRAIPSGANFALRSCLSKRQREEKRREKRREKRKKKGKRGVEKGVSGIYRKDI